MSHEYAFDVKLAAVCRVKAETEVIARDAMDRVLDSCSPTQDFIDGYNDVSAQVRITEFSLSCSDDGALFELDGEEVIRTPTCPVCGGHEFIVPVGQLVTVMFDGSGEHAITEDARGDMEWTDDSDVICNDCHHAAKLREMQTAQRHPSASSPPDDVSDSCLGT